MLVKLLETLAMSSHPSTVYIKNIHTCIDVRGRRIYVRVKRKVFPTAFSSIYARRHCSCRTLDFRLQFMYVLQGSIGRLMARIITVFHGGIASAVILDRSMYLFLENTHAPFY